MKTIMTLSGLLLVFISFGQNKSIEGNGKIVTKERSITEFYELNIDMYCDVTVALGSMPLARITADKNTIDKISLKITDGKLVLKVKEGYWLQSSRPSVYLQTPYLTHLNTDGQQTNIGDVHIHNINVDKFSADILYGNITLTGNTNQLEIKSSNNGMYRNRSTLDASGLIAKEVDATIKGSNTAIIYVTDQLKAHLKHDAVIEYYGNPEKVSLSGDATEAEQGIITAQNKKPKKMVASSDGQDQELQYIECQVRNNSPLRKNFYIKGPSPSGGFSYGFPLMPFATRTKKVPVGTVIFLDKGGILRKKLVTITDTDEGQVVNLF